MGKETKNNIRVELLHCLLFVARFAQAEVLIDIFPLMKLLSV